MIVIGGDEKLFSGLLEEISTDEVSIIVPRDDRETQPALTQILERQEAKAIEVLRLKPEDITTASPFSLTKAVSAIQKIASSLTQGAALEVFVAGPKPFAAAAAVCASADRQIYVTARLPTTYKLHAVTAAGPFWTYQILDLINPELSMLDINFSRSS